MAETIQPTQTANAPYAGGGAGTAIGSLVGGLFNLIGSGINYGAQQQANMKNEELLRESWARDDSQMQRARADAEKAGFSPLAALGNKLGNTNPTTMQAPQLDTSGVSNSIEGALNRKQAYDAMKQQQTLIKAQVEQAEEETEAKKLDNLIRLAKAYDEIWGSKLEIGDKIGAMLEAGIIKEDDVPEMYKIFKATKTPGKERELTEREIKAKETSNANTAWSIANQAEQFKETMAASKETRETTAEYTTNFGVGSIRLQYKRSETGNMIPMTQDIDPTKEAAMSGEYKAYNPKGTIESKGLVWAGYNADGHPVGRTNYTSTENQRYYVMVPSGKYSVKFYQISPHDVTDANYWAWQEKFGKDYTDMWQRLKESDSFK